MGDVLHLLPALSDLHAAIPEAQIDWMVEDSFAEIPKWHSAIARVIPVSTRRWRRITRKNFIEFRAFVKELRAQSYDYVIDAQGLMKSSGLGRFAKLNRGGQRIGFSAASIKEKHAAWFYHKGIDVAPNQHAIDRLRQLFSHAFNYPLANDRPHYAIQMAADERIELGTKTIVLLHGTTWPSKHLPDPRWRELCALIVAAGYRIKIPWGNESEKKRADWIAQGNEKAEVLGKSSLSQLALVLKQSSGVIAVDTGLGHLAAALSVPAVSVYGATEAKLTGAVGESQSHLQSSFHCSPCFLKECDKLNTTIKQIPCYDGFSAEVIWARLQQQIDAKA